MTLTGPGAEARRYADADGRLHLQPLAAGAYELTTRAGPNTSAERTLSVGPDRDVVTATLRLADAAGTGTNGR